MSTTSWCFLEIPISSSGQPRVRAAASCARTTAGTIGTSSPNSKFDLAEFGALVIDPNVANAQTLYVAISGGTANFNMGSGVYKSADGGATWSDPVKFVQGFSGFSGFVSDLLEIQENGQTVLYAADAGNGQPGKGGIYRSADGGVNWTATSLPANANGYNSIRLAGSTMPTERIYASTIDSTGLDTRLSTSSMGGNWSQLNWPNAPGGAPKHRDRHNLLAVDPANSNIVYVNTDLENNAMTLEFVWRSGDGGQNWQAAGGAGDPASATFDSQGVFIATGDNGVYRRNPLTFNLDQKCGNLNTSPFYSFSLDPTNTRSAYALMQDAPGTLKYTGNLVWQYTQPLNAQGEAGKIRVDPTNASRVYYLDPNTPQRLLLGLSSVFETKTGGDPNMADPLFGGKGWRDIGANMGNKGQNITAIALAPSDPNTVYAGTYDGHVFKTSNAGDANPAWNPVETGLVSNGQTVMDLKVSPTDPNYVFAVLSKFVDRDDKAPNLSGSFHVWAHSGGGWSQINGNLPTELGGESLAVDWQPATPKLYLGTQRGVFGSDDLGTTWTRFDSLPRTRVTDLDFVPSLNLVGAGTFGRGAWEILTKSTPPAVTPPANQKSVEGASHLFDLGSFTDPDGGPWTVDVAWGDGTADTVFTALAPGAIASQNHTYGEEGTYIVTIKVTDTLDGQNDSKTFTVTVSDPAVLAAGVPVNAIAGAACGAALPVPIATYTDPGGAEPNASDSGPLGNH